MIAKTERNQIRGRQIFDAGMPVVFDAAAGRHRALCAKRPPEEAFDELHVRIADQRSEQPASG